MFDTLWSILAGNGFEVYTAIIATLGVRLWVVDRLSMKAALSAAQQHETTILRIKRQEVEAALQQSFASLQMKCETVRKTSQNNMILHGPRLGSVPYKSKEDEDVRNAMGIASSLVRNLEKHAPKRDCSDIKQLERYFAFTVQAMIQIERLSSEL